MWVQRLCSKLGRASDLAYCPGEPYRMLHGCQASVPMLSGGVGVEAMISS